MKTKNTKKFLKTTKNLWKTPKNYKFFSKKQIENIFFKNQNKKIENIRKIRKNNHFLK